MLGVANQNSSHSDKAVAAFEKCAAVKDNLQAICASGAEQAKKDATQAWPKYVLLILPARTALLQFTAPFMPGRKTPALSPDRSTKRVNHMSDTQFLEKIDAAIAEKNLLNHPFYQDWQAG